GFRSQGTPKLRKFLTEKPHWLNGHDYDWMSLLYEEESDPNELCPRIEDIEGNCKVYGPKACEKYMSTTYKEKYINCTCDNIVMLHKINRYCKCNIRCIDLPAPDR
ncbi:unnamed protein product, partial [Brassica oleracea]